MPAHHRHTRWGLAVAAVFVAAACKDSSGPQAHLSDPTGLSTDLQAVSAVLESSIFQSFSAVSDSTTGSPVAAPSRAGALLQAAPIVPPRSATAPYANTPARLQALRRVATGFGRVISASVVPPTLLGKTFTWSATTHAYAEDAAYTPAAAGDRVRIILYAVDPITLKIVETPLTPTGFVDLVDESTTAPAVDKLHVIVSGGTPGGSSNVEYANYTVSAQVTGNPVTAFTATASGFVSDGTHTLTFDATFAATQVDTDNPDLQIDVTWGLSDPAIQVVLHETVTQSDADHATLTITEFSITRGAETVSMHGAVAVVLSSASVTMNLTIDVNGVPWVRITGTDASLAVRHADGSQLSAAEAQAFLDLFNLSFSCANAMSSMFGPPGTLMGA
jgi:hypothetical protein